MRDQEIAESTPLKAGPDWPALFGAVGSVLILGGIFIPVIDAPDLGSVNFFHTPDGNAVLAAGICSLLLISIRAYLGAGVLGLLTAALFYDTYEVFQRSRPINTTWILVFLHNQLGWLVLFLGSLLLLLSGAAAVAVRRKTAGNSANPATPVQIAATVVSLLLIGWIWWLPERARQERVRADDQRVQQAESQIKSRSAQKHGGVGK